MKRANKPELIAVLLDETRLTLDELASSCTVSRQWVIERIQAGALDADPGMPPEQWRFSSRDLLRVRRLQDVERTFDANPELAALVADLFDEVGRLRARLRAAGFQE
ncbi:chaperone modulator CbpM [Lacisediminimonas profundi]|uniref:chaperone modulator CbpM n=1 Tax=Lacisediminimonas profundi TaxID=2603856 RepID=UPI00124B6FB2|nr:chaperone modulator CbpM [Lacisediminimonas profundi]